MGSHSFNPRWLDKTGKVIKAGDVLRLEFSLLDKETMKEIRKGVQLANTTLKDGVLEVRGLLGEDLTGWLHNPGEPMIDVEIVPAFE